MRAKANLQPAYFSFEKNGTVYTNSWDEVRRKVGRIAFSPRIVFNDYPIPPHCLPEIRGAIGEIRGGNEEAKGKQQGAKEESYRLAAGGGEWMLAEIVRFEAPG